MESLALRILRNEPGKFEEILSRQGTVLLNKEGRPFALAVSVAEASLEETVRLVTQVRALLAVSGMREQARSRGLSAMTQRQVDEAIQSSRARRKA